MGRQLHVLFVCTANICRSPMAEAFMAHHIAKAEIAASTSSAAVLKGERRVHALTRQVLAARGIEPPKSHSDHLTPAIGERADVILTMTGDHALSVGWTLRPKLNRVFMLDHFASVAPARAESESASQWLDRISSIPRAYPNQQAAVDIADPMGQDLAVFEAVGDQLWDLTEKVATALA